MINTSQQQLLSISNTLEREVSDNDDVVDDNSCTCEPTKVYKLLGYALKTQKTKQKRKRLNM